MSLGRFLRSSSLIYKGEHMKLEGFKGARGRTVVAEPLGKTPILIDLDGEQPGRLPVRYEIVPKAIKLMAPWKTAVAVDA